MRALLTGISGFIGNCLAEYLISKKWEVFGFDHRASEKFNQSFVGSITDREAIGKAIQNSQPDVIFHLAGAIKANTAREYFETNVLGTQTLFEALVEAGLKTRVVIASTSAVYGPGMGKRPIKESFALHPMTDYAASKASQEMVARRFFLGYGFPVIFARTFNLIGPGQSPELACSAFARQIALDERSSTPEPIRTGNLAAKRDFVDVRDAVRAYELIASQGRPGAIYNVCSGKGIALAYCLSSLLGMASKPLVTELDRKRVQINDVPIQVGSAELIQREFGWQPQISLQQSLQDLLNDWRERVKFSLEDGNVPMAS